MSRALKWRIAAAVLIVFVAGIATGIFATAWHVQHHFGQGRTEVIAERMRRHLTRQLGLTPEQLAYINPVIDQTAARLSAIRSETGRRVGETMDQSRREIAPHLGPEQLEKLDRMREHHRRMMRRGHFSPPPDGA